jgi:hypothetical protein
MCRALGLLERPAVPVHVEDDHLHDASDMPCPPVGRRGRWSAPFAAAITQLLSLDSDLFYVVAVPIATVMR